jgi:hypothetical protein
MAIVDFCMTKVDLAHRRANSSFPCNSLSFCVYEITEYQLNAGPAIEQKQKTKEPLFKDSLCETPGGRLKNIEHADGNKADMV